MALGITLRSIPVVLNRVKTTELSVKIVADSAIPAHDDDLMIANIAFLYPVGTEYGIVASTEEFILTLTLCVASKLIATMLSIKLLFS